MGNTSSTPEEIEPCFEPAKIIEIETSEEKDKRTLRHLIRANHINYSILYHDLKYHNHLTHLLCSAYALGANPQQLEQLYEVETSELEKWEDSQSPGEVVGGDWRDYLGDRRYQRAFLDLYEDEIYRHKYDWKAVLHEYLFDEETPLISGLIGGVGHPLIHLGFALEFDNKEMAMEALTLASVDYRPRRKYVEKQPSDGPQEYRLPVALLQSFSEDERLNGVFMKPGTEEFERLWAKKGDVMTEYLHAVDFTHKPPLDILHDLVKAAVLMVVTAHAPGKPEFDFFNVHVLTSAYALRVVLPTIKDLTAEKTEEEIKGLLRDMWLLNLETYASQLRPKIGPQILKNVNLEGKDWKYVLHLATGGSKQFQDAHYVKAIRAMYEFSKLWREDEDFFLRAAVYFAESFNGWRGFADERGSKE